METVAQSLSLGDVSVDLFNKMFTNLSMFGPQLEIYSKEILDRCFIIYRNASQDDRLKITIRLNLLNLIELRANSWQLSEGLNTYYKHKAATNVEVSGSWGCAGLWKARIFFQLWREKFFDFEEALSIKNIFNARSIEEIDFKCKKINFTTHF